MSLNPTPTVLSTLTTHKVQHLLMGGQACMLYGAVQFSRDTDIAILADSANLERLKAALDELQAVSIAVPPFELRHLSRGHALHFRCQRPDLSGLRVDVMSKMRGVDSFEQLWARRTTLRLADGIEMEMMGLVDLVQTKKTRRLKDWPMLVSLVEVHYAQDKSQSPSAEVIEFWLLECRTATTLCNIVDRFPEAARQVASHRPLLLAAIQKDLKKLELGIQQEWAREREIDDRYWQPLSDELEQMRLDRRK